LCAYTTLLLIKLPFRREFLKKKYMTAIESKINQVSARIMQIKESDLFTFEERERLVTINQKELDKLELVKAKEIKVLNPETL